MFKASISRKSLVSTAARRSLGVRTGRHYQTVASLAPGRWQEETARARTLCFCIRLALKCFYGGLRGGFNGRLRGFRWIISGAGGRRRKKEASCPRVWVRASRCEKPRQRGSVTRLNHRRPGVRRRASSVRRLVAAARVRCSYWRLQSERRSSGLEIYNGLVRTEAWKEISPGPFSSMGSYDRPPAAPRQMRTRGIRARR